MSFTLKAYTKNTRTVLRTILATYRTPYILLVFIIVTIISYAFSSSSIPRLRCSTIYC